VPYGTDSRSNGFQAMNCLATIILSLRDGGPSHTILRSAGCLATLI
jgi:hypothetical protein